MISYFSKNGYIALTSSIIVSILIMAIVLAVSTFSFFNRSNILDSELKQKSRALAEACVETALLKLKQSSSYSGNENITVGNDQCSILTIESGSGQKIIKTTANSQNIVANFKITVSDPAVEIIFWEELANF